MNFANQYFLLSFLIFASNLGLSQGFPSGNVYVAASRNAQIFEFDNNLNFISSWTHPSFGTVLPPPGQSFANGPAGMAFDPTGNLVVAGLNQFCVFSGPGVVINCFPKISSVVTETVIIDRFGNLFTTNGTGGNNLIQKYDPNFNYLGSIPVPTGSLTGLTCDANGDIFVASQACSCIYKIAPGTSQVLDVISGLGNVEGLQITYNNQLLVAESGQGIKLIQASSPLNVVNSITNPGLFFAHNLTIDNLSNIYIGDFEDGGGNLPADIYKFGPNGSLINSVTPSPIYGPFQILISGTNLPHNISTAVPTLSTWFLILLFLLILCIGAIAILRRQSAELQF